MISPEMVYTSIIKLLNLNSGKYPFTIKINNDFYLDFRKENNHHSVYILGVGPVIFAGISSTGKTFYPDESRAITPCNNFTKFNKLLTEMECNWEEIYIELQTRMIQNI